MGQTFCIGLDHTHTLPHVSNVYSPAGGDILGGVLGGFKNWDPAEEGGILVVGLECHSLALVSHSLVHCDVRSLCHMFWPL